MRFTYPFEREIDGETVLVTFPDVPGALTQCDPGVDVSEVASDCLVAALGGYVLLRRPIPRPSALKGRESVSLDAVTSAKLALATAMIEKQVTNVALGKNLGVSEKAVRRLVDLDHASRIEKVEAALSVLGKHLEIAVRSVPRPVVPAL